MIGIISNGDDDDDDGDDVGEVIVTASLVVMPPRSCKLPKQSAPRKKNENSHGTWQQTPFSKRRSLVGSRIISGVRMFHSFRGFSVRCKDLSVKP